MVSWNGTEELSVAKKVDSSRSFCLREMIFLDYSNSVLGIPPHPITGKSRHNHPTRLANVTYVTYMTMNHHTLAFYVQKISATSKITLRYKIAVLARLCISDLVSIFVPTPRMPSRTHSRSTCKSRINMAL